jgi:hypothetical protein
LRSMYGPANHMILQDERYYGGKHACRETAAEQLLVAIVDQHDGSSISVASLTCVQAHPRRLLLSQCLQQQGSTTKCLSHHQLLPSSNASSMLLTSAHLCSPVQIYVTRTAIRPDQHVTVWQSHSRGPVQCTTQPHAATPDHFSPHINVHRSREA